MTLLDQADQQRRWTQEAVERAVAYLDRAERAEHQILNDRVAKTIGILSDHDPGLCGAADNVVDALEELRGR